MNVLLEIGMYQYFLLSQTIEGQLKGLDELAEYARMQVNRMKNKVPNLNPNSACFLETCHVFLKV